MPELLDKIKDLDDIKLYLENNLTYLEVLGKGAFGSVLKAFDKQLGKFYAIKSISQGDGANEIEIMSKLNTLQNPNLIQINLAYDDFDQKEKILM